MLLTGGGLLIWWIIDRFKMKRNSKNTIQTLLFKRWTTKVISKN